jgi:sialic acid synthase SpsE/mannose-6-phosphate isomerase-like protein (cupin superfamily)
VSFPFTDRRLVIFELANNHMGDVEHGLRVVREIAAVARDFPFRFAFKLQYRQLDSFIHPAFRDRDDIKFVKRFRETRLSNEDFSRILGAIREEGMLTCCTPFDEASVGLIEQQGFDLLKIASCSITDWSLVERIGAAHLPVIGSTAGISFEELDNVVSFFDHRQRPFALMHCVAEYPTPDGRLELGQIGLLKQRYPAHVVGYSTHENPQNIESVQVAIGLGAEILEKHVGVSTHQHALNTYSASPDQVRKWLESAARAQTMVGSTTGRYAFSQKELADLSNLRRGVFARRSINAGERLNAETVFFAIPSVDEQVLANDLGKYVEFVANRGIEEGEAVLAADVQRVDNRQTVHDIVRNVKSFLKQTHLPLPSRIDLEISHHYGIDSFFETGAVLLNCVNREYCKKIIVMLPGQFHPEHWHEVKEETFHVQFGEMTMDLDGKTQSYKAGDLILVPAGARHSFRTESGVIFEEISSTHRAADSFYADPRIMGNKMRKTLLTYWLD